MADHEESCKHGQKATEQWERDCLKQHRWFAHIIYEDKTSPTKFNYHTHGLSEFFDHPDLQIVFPLPPKDAHAVMTRIVDRIKHGKRFNDNDVMSGVINESMSIMFIKVSEDNREVLRVIIPGPDGIIDKDKMEHPYCHQYK